MSIAEAARRTGVSVHTASSSDLKIDVCRGLAAGDPDRRWAPSLNDG